MSEREERLRIALEQQSEHVTTSPQLRRRIDMRRDRRASTFRSRGLALSMAVVLVAVGVVVWFVAGREEQRGPVTGTSAPADTYFEGYWPVGTKAEAEALQRKVDGGEETWRRKPDEVARAYGRSLGWDVAEGTDDVGRTVDLPDGETEVTLQPMIGEGDREMPGPAHQVRLVSLADVDEPAWFVAGITSPNITVDEPRQNATITSPLRVAGSGVAFEGNILAAVVPDPTDAEADTAFGGQPIQAGATEPAPFESSLTFAPPNVPAGTVEFQGGNGLGAPAWDVTVVRVRFEEASTQATPQANDGPIADEATADDAFRCFFNARHDRDLEMAKPCMTERYVDSIGDPLEFIGPSSPSVERATIISSSRTGDRVVYDAHVYWGSSSGLQFVSEDTVVVRLDGERASIDAWTQGAQVPVDATRNVTLTFLAAGDAPRCEGGAPTTDSFTTIDRVVPAEAVVDDLALSVVRELATGHWAHERDGDNPFPAATRVERVAVADGVATVELNDLTRFGGCRHAASALRQSLLRLDGITDVQLREAPPQEVPSEPDV